MSSTDINRPPPSAGVESSTPAPDDVATYKEACERCKKLTVLREEDTSYDEDGIYHYFGTIRDLTPRTRNCCAMISSIRESFVFKDHIEPSQDETIFFEDSIEPSLFRIHFRDRTRTRGREFGSLKLDTYDMNDTAIQMYFGSPHALVPSSNNYDRAKYWVQECLSNHEVCNKVAKIARKVSILPTRLLELTDGQIRLRSSETLTKPVDYVTLSHMWGAHPEKQLRLVESRLEEFETNVPIHELSQIFRRAIEITRQLGHCYLWIDSLCIIQDSKVDWEREASSMCTIYSNGTCNLSFLFPPEDDGTGYYSNASTRRPCTLRPASTTEKGIWIRPECPNTRELSTKNPYWDWLLPSKWPLFTTAWAFQEYLLSQCTILLGHGTMLWQCSEQGYDEFMGPVQINIPKSQIWTSAEHQIHWNDLIDEYTRRQITRSEDMNMALAGVADRFGRAHGLTYLAGLFLEHMPHALLWCRNGHKLPTRKSFLDTAPSWSPLSAPLCPHRASLSAPSRYNLYWESHLEFYRWAGYPLNVLPPASLYDFSGLRLAVEVIVVPTKLDKIPKLPPLLHQLGLQPLLAKQTPNYVCRLDAHEDDNGSNGEVLMAVLEVYSPDGVASMQGLLPIPGVEEDTWKRIGFWVHHISYPGDSREQIKKDVEELRSRATRTLILI